MAFLYVACNLNISVLPPEQQQGVPATQFVETREKEAVSLEENEGGRAPVELTEVVVLATLIAAPSVEVQSNRFKIFSNIL